MDQDFMSATKDIGNLLLSPIDAVGKFALLNLHVNHSLKFTQ